MRRKRALWQHVVLACLCVFSAAAAFAQDKWLEVQSPNFTVISNAGERQARRVAAEFEQFRAVFQAALPQARVDPGRPVFVVAVRDQKTMREWLPGFFEQESQVRPSGIFVSGDDRHYAAVQLGVSGPSPYHNLYHEYVHLLNELNFGRLPAWLSEGLAEVYATALIGESSVDLGRPDEGHLRLLRDNRPLPLETLLRVDHASPNYNETDKASIFYAQSWALTHMLLFGDASRRGQLEEYLRRSARGDDPVTAAQAFGDLRELERQLQLYCRRPSFRLASIPAPAPGDPQSYSLRELSAAEAHARHGDFLLHTHRPAEARLALEAAIQLDEDEPLALEALATLALMEDDREVAFLWLQRAVAGDSRSHLTHYYYAMLLAERATEPEQAEVAEEHLEKALALNPDFASGHAAISSFYLVRPMMQEDALRHAQRAVELKPEDVEFQVNLGRILVRLQRFEEGLDVGQKALAQAATDPEREAAKKFLASTRKYMEELDAWKKAEEAARVEAEERRKRKEAEAIARANEPPPPPPPSEPAWGTGPRRRVTGSAVEGWLTSVTCSGKTMDIQLNLGAYSLRLHSGDYFTMGFLAAGWVPPEDFDPCKHLKGRRALAIYRAVEGKAHAGEILALQIQK